MVLMGWIDVNLSKFFPFDIDFGYLVIEGLGGRQEDATGGLLRGGKRKRGKPCKVNPCRHRKRGASFFCYI